MVESLGVCDELAAAGQVPRRLAAPVGDDGRHRPRAGRPDARHRRPVRRDDRATRRLLRARPGRPRRGDRGRRAGSRRSPRGRSRSARCSPSTACRRAGRSRPAGAAGTPYLLLCYDDEAAWQAAGPGRPARRDGGGRRRSPGELDDAGRYLSASPLHPAATATCVRVRDGKRVDHRRPVRRDARGARRLLPDPGRVPRRGRPGRRPAPRRAARRGRGPAAVRPVRAAEPT